AAQWGPERHPLDRRRPVGALGQQPGDAGVEGGRPQPGVLLGPARMGEGDVIGHIGRGDQAAVGGVQGGVGALAADVAADHIGAGHGTTTIFRPVPDRMVSNASPIRSRGNWWVTTGASSFRRRLRYSMVIRYWRGGGPEAPRVGRPPLGGGVVSCAGAP